MLSSDHRAAKAIMDMKLREAQAQQETELLLREVGQEPRGWLAEQCCSLLRQFGRRLVAWGHRLERSGLAQDVQLERKPCTGSGA